MANSRGATLTFRFRIGDPRQAASIQAAPETDLGVVPRDGYLPTLPADAARCRDIPPDPGKPLVLSATHPKWLSGPGRGTMTDKLKLGEEILANLAAIQDQSHRDNILGDEFELPRLIGAGDGRTLQVTKAIDDKIAALADQLKAERPKLVKTITRNDFVSLVRVACGPILAELDLDRPFAETGAELVAGVEKSVNEQLAGLLRREHTFGVTLFGNPGVAPFSIGPVRFEDWDAWLTRKRADGGLSATTERRLRKAWAGKKLSERKPGMAASQERNILCAMRRAPYVASVWIEGFASSAGLEAAATAVRLAVTTVAVLWPTPSRALEGMRLRFDPSHHTEEAVTFVPGRVVIGGFRMRGTPFGPSLKPDQWVSSHAAVEPIFSAAGDAIALLTNPDDNPPRVGVLRALLQSLMWFYAGCRELSDPIAIVNFTASLDALASGAQSQGILDVLKARLGWAPGAAFYADGTTLKQVVEKLYGEGRSQLVHGTSKRIGYDWAAERAQAESLADHALLACLEFVAASPTVDKAKALRV